MPAIARLRGVGNVCVNRPHVWLIPVVLLGLIIGLGTWAVMEGANSTADTNRQKAVASVKSAASAMALTIQAAVMPVVQLEDWIRHTVNVTTLNDQYVSRVSEWLAAQPKIDGILSMAPAGYITQYWPPIVLLPPEMNLLTTPAIKDLVIASLATRGMEATPPYPSQGRDGGDSTTLVMTFNLPVYLTNVTEEQLWPWKRPTGCPPGLCYDPATKSGWWGCASYTINLEWLISSQGPISDLVTAEYSVQLWRSPFLPRGETDWATITGQEPLPQPADAVCSSLPVVPGAEWRICAWQDSWEPVWKLPLIIVVVVAGVVCGLLVFTVLLSWEEHRVLLHSILPKEAINRMRQQIDFDTLKQDQQALKGIEIETPAQHMLSILECVLAGETPPMSMVVAVQQALQRSQDVYRPASDDLKMRLKEDSRLDDEVQRALVNQLAGTVPIARHLSNISAVEAFRAELDIFTGDVSMSKPSEAKLLGASGMCDTDFNNVTAALSFLATPQVVGDEMISASDVIENPVYASRDTTGASDHMAVTVAPAKPFLDKLDRVLATANTWQFDAYALEEASSGHPLSVLGYWLMHTSGCMEFARMHGVVLARFLRRIEAGYKTNAYHNKRHAADVLQTFHMIMHQGGLKPGYVDELTLLGCYLAAIVHDYEHVGRSNDFLVNTRDTLALRYNDKSPMENHHLAAAWELLQQPEYNCLSGLSKTKWEQLRKLVIDLVLATDMRQHFAIMGQFTALHSLQNTGPPRSNSERSTQSRSEGVESVSPVNDQDKLLSLQVALKCCDLGHLAAPLNVHLKWVSALEEELFLQGDEERRRGMPLSPLCDRNKEGVTKSQVGFMEFVVLPVFTNFCQRFKASSPLLDAVVANYTHWKKMMPQKGSA